MFTGLIEEKGKVAETDISPGSAGTLKIGAERVLDEIEIGDSVSISGVCLTVVELKDSSLIVEIMPETLKRTTLGELRRGDGVNLERALKVGDRLGGHIVNGHVDGVGVIRSRIIRENAIIFEIEADKEILSFMVPKGSVALDGISLTLVDVGDGSFTVSIIPHTLRVTTLEEAKVGDRVNIEVDILAKYAARALSADAGVESEESLRSSLIEGGFIDNQ